MRTRLTRIVLVVLSALVLGACGGGVGGNAVATVNDAEVPTELFERLVRAQVNNPASGLDQVEDEARLEQIGSLQRQILTQLIRTRVLEQAALARGITVTEQEVQERFEQEQAFRGSPEEFAARIAELGYTEQDARGVLRSVLLQEKFEADFTAEIEITEEDLRAYYEERKPFEYELADVRHILVETQEEAQEIVDLLAGGADFAQLAEERSLDQASAVQGGSLGQAPKGSYVQEFEDAVWSAEEGAIVGPIESQFGFHIIRVDEFVDVSFEEARDEIAQVLEGRAGQESLNAFIQDLFAQADVDVDSRFGRWDPQTAQVVPDTLEG